MEKTDTIAIPAEFSSPPKKFNPINNLRKNKKPLDLEETRTRLPKVNRSVKCVHCEQDRILNPEQYQSYFDYWGDEEKLLRNFICKPCDMQIQLNPFKFWTVHSDHYSKLSKTLKIAFDLFNNSQKTSNDEMNMTKMIVDTLKIANIEASPNLLSNNHLEFMIDNRVVRGMKIKNIPFVGTVTITPYESTKITVS